MKARMRLAESLEKDSPSFQYYLLHLLETIVSKGDVRENDDNKHKADIQLVAQEIGQLLKPLAELAPSFADYGEVIGEESTAPLQREMWFNIVVHGITPGSPLWDRHLNELQQLAVYTKPLVAKDRTDHLESDIELNTVLRRGMNAPHTAEMKRQLIKLLPSQEASIRSLAYPKVIFLLAAYSLETLRADTGKCSDVLSYFIDPSVNQDTTAACMEAIADEVMSKFLARTLGGIRSDSTAPYVANELAQMLATCCHRIYKCQQVAARLSDRLIAQMPSSLCQKSSLFALLELLSLMWSSCLEAELDEYEWKSTYVSQLANVSLELSDDFEFRKRTLHGFHRQARSWTARIINLAPLDVKGLLQTYLSEYDDDGAYGHVSLGRSFAIEMGSVIPSADQRLGALDRQDQCNINTGSDFIAQYTTRQEYRYADALPEYDQGWVQGSQSSKCARFLQATVLNFHPDNNSYVLSKADQEVRDAQAILAVLERRVSDHKYVAVGELRDILRRAAALLSRSTMDQCAIVHQLVGIPFSIFTKQSIKLGISLWLGVINENHIMESRILVEIARQWEDLVQKKRGIFDDKFQYVYFHAIFYKANLAQPLRSFLYKGRVCSVR